MNKIGLSLFPFLFLAFWGCEGDHSEHSALSLIYPDGQESLIIGESYTIRWNAPESSTLRIDLYQNGDFVSNIVEEISDTIAYNWQIAEIIPSGKNYSIQISNLNDPYWQVQSKSAFQLLEPGIESIFFDARDGTTYRTVNIGDQTWLAENFRFDAGEGAFCYWYDTSLCMTLGRLYTLEAALAAQPDGWHLPTDDEWKELERYLGMRSDELHNFGSRGLFIGKLLRIDGGSGFDAVFSGYYNGCFEKFGHVSYESHFWSSSKSDDRKPIIRIIRNTDEVMRLASNCHQGCSVRYIKD